MDKVALERSVRIAVRRTSLWRKQQCADQRPQSSFNNWRNGNGVTWKHTTSYEAYQEC
jgi:hypothetical protein